MQLKNGQIVTLRDDFVEVINVFNITGAGIVCFLRCPAGKIESQAILSDSMTGHHWMLTGYRMSFGSHETFEVIKEQESANIFQYPIKCIGHDYKPINGSKLKITHCDMNQMLE